MSFSCVPVGFDLTEVTGFEVARRRAQVRAACTNLWESGSFFVLCFSLTHADAQAPRHANDGLCPNRRATLRLMLVKCGVPSACGHCSNNFQARNLAQTGRS